MFADYLVKGVCLDITSTGKVLYGTATPQLLAQTFMAQTCKAAVTNCRDGLTTVYHVQTFTWIPTASSLHTKRDGDPRLCFCQPNACSVLADVMHALISLVSQCVQGASTTVHGNTLQAWDAVTQLASPIRMS